MEHVNLKTEAHPAGYRVIAVLNMLLGVLRIYFAYLGTTEAIKEFLTVPVSSTTMTIINAAFLLLGLGGLIASTGLYLRRSWGVRAIVLVSLGNIVLDAWGYTIQSTAAMGVVIPVAAVCFTLRAIGQGLHQGGGSLAWTLGHLDFSRRHDAELYMGVHVTLTGLRGLIAPFVGVALGGLIGWGAWAVALVLCLLGVLTYHRLAQSDAGRTRTV